MDHSYRVQLKYAAFKSKARYWTMVCSWRDKCERQWTALDEAVNKRELMSLFSSADCWFAFFLFARIHTHRSDEAVVPSRRGSFLSLLLISRPGLTHGSADGREAVQGNRLAG